MRGRPPGAGAVVVPAADTRSRWRGSTSLSGGNGGAGGFVQCISTSASEVLNRRKHTPNNSAVGRMLATDAAINAAYG
jgi:hypothetical protein